MTLRVRAPAKVNLFLEITGKRPDGYHTLSTIFQTISLADELVLSPAEDVTLTCSNPALPTDKSNLVMRAALRLKALLKESRGVRMHLKKNVPMGAGLGGGSSDAAAVLLGLPRLWRRRVPFAVLHRCAKELGADVPFFLKGGTCIGTGIGDRLKPLPALPRTWLVLVYPGFGVSTKEAYARVQLNSIPHPLPLPSRERVKGEGWSPLLFNRFEEFVFPLHPRLTRLKGDLLDAGVLGALMSGSGSTIFGLAASQAHGQRMLKKLRRKYPQSWLVHTV